MGFLDGLMKSATRKIISEVVDNVMDDVVSNIRGNNGTEGSNEGLVNESKSTVSTENVTVETVTFKPAHLSGLMERQFDFYTGDESGNDVILNCSFRIPKEFVDYGNCGAAEIDCCYVYSPEDVEEDYVEDSTGKPMIYLGDDGYNRTPVDSYLKTGKVKAGVKLEKIEGSFVKYKTVSETNSDCFVVYHYYRKFDNDVLYQIVLQYPKKFKGTDFGKEMEQALDCLVSTYKENVKEAE